MQILLRDSSGLFYAGRHLRTADASGAADFRNVNIAANVAVADHLAAPEVVLNYLSPPCQLALPVRPEWFPCDSSPLTQTSDQDHRVLPHDNQADTSYSDIQVPAHMPERMTIMLVEDLEDDILLVRRAFAAVKVTTPLHVVRDGEEAIEYLEGVGKYSNRAEYPVPHLILLDLKMPKMGGIEVLRWIKLQPELKALRVVVLTSSEDISDVNEAYEAGANSFLVKPLEFINYPAMMQTLSKFWLRDSQAPIVERPPASRTSP